MNHGIVRSHDGIRSSYYLLSDDAVKQQPTKTTLHLQLPNLHSHIDTMAANNETDLEALHPAANVFRSVVLGDIGGDNACLKEEISKLQPL